MSTLIFHIILISCLVYSGAFADTGGFIHVDEESPFVSYESSEYYLTVPRADIAGTDYWGKWKLNMSNYNWELIDYGTSATGTRTASGEYIYNAQKGILIYKFEHSTFYECGPKVGTGVWYVSPITQTSMTWIHPEPRAETPPIVLTRVSGKSGDIAGEWNYGDEINTYTATFNSNGSVTLVGNIVDCS